MIPGVVVLVAVRLKSRRLPRKALLDLAGAPVLQRLMERMAKARTPEHVVVCTSVNPQDDPIADLCAAKGFDCHRGHELDVMGRFLDVVRKYDAKYVVRVTGDNPLTDPVMLDRMVEETIARDAEYAHTDDLPRGTRAEVISADALKRCHEMVQDPNASEYMTLMLKRPDKFRILTVPSAVPAVVRPDLRLTLDTPEDYSVVSTVYESLGGDPGPLEAVIDWLDRNPEIAGGNADITPTEIDGSINVALKGDD